MLLLLLVWRAAVKPAEGIRFRALLLLGVLEPAEGFAMSSLVALAPAWSIEPAQGFSLGAASCCLRACARLWHRDWGACVVHSDVGHRACARLGVVARSRDWRRERGVGGSVPLGSVGRADTSLDKRR